MPIPGCTPPPWEVETAIFTNSFAVVTPCVTGEITGILTIARINTLPVASEKKANARAIATVHQLYDALEAMLKHANREADTECEGDVACDCPYEDVLCVFCQARAALAAARGETT